MEKQTAVEWLFAHLVPHLDWSKVEHRELFRKLKEEALAMEKEQIVNTFKDAQVFKIMDYEIRGEQYYKQTFGGKDE